jgi:hypothetical protein
MAFNVALNSPRKNDHVVERAQKAMSIRMRHKEKK